MWQANSRERQQPGLSEALLRFGMLENRQAGASASEKIANGTPAMLPLWAKTDVRCYAAVLNEVSVFGGSLTNGCVKLHHTLGGALAALDRA